MASTARSGPRDSAGLSFVAEMYGVQLDQLAVLLDLSLRQTANVVSRWNGRGLAESGVLSPGPRWVWLTRAGLLACGARYAAAPPALPRLEHIRAVTSVRLVLQATPSYQAGSAHWRSERHLRARLGGRFGARDHLPDGEVHWPDEVPGAPALAWAGECWAIEAERTPKTLSRTTAIMTELLTRTGDYGCPAADARVHGLPPRHTRVLYLCSAAAAGTARRARESLGSMAERVEVRPLPASARVPGAPK